MATDAMLTPFYEEQTRLTTIRERMLAERAELQGELDGLRRELAVRREEAAMLPAPGGPGEISAEHRQLMASRDQVRAEHQVAAAELDGLHREIADARGTLGAVNAEIKLRRDELDKLNTEVSGMLARIFSPTTER